MKIKELNEKPNINQDKKTEKKYAYFKKLIHELSERELSREVVNNINLEVEKINSFLGSDRDLRKQLQKSQTAILNLIESKLGLVTKHHFQNRWMVYGMILGILFSTIFSTMGFSSTWSSLGMGISMGLLFGMVAGKNRDEKAKRMGLQLHL